MDFDSPSRPASYSVSTTYNEQWHSSSDDADSSNDNGLSSHSTSTDSDSDHDRRTWRSPKDVVGTYHNVYSNSSWKCTGSSQ